MKAVRRVALVSIFVIGRLSAANLQQAVDRAMGGRAGAALVLDIHSGRLLAHHHLELAARRLARPGSTVKPFTLLALLASGSAPRALVCGRSLRIGARQMDCTHPPTSDPLDAPAALAYSCNFYFGSLAARLHDSDLAETFTRAGLTQAQDCAQAKRWARSRHRRMSSSANCSRWVKPTY